MSEPTGKPSYKIGEVCELTGTQPYVLRFWESEFPTLAPEKNRSGQRVYRQRDITLIEKIKVLLYDKEYTIAGARKVLEEEGWDDLDSALMAGGTETETTSAATRPPQGAAPKRSSAGASQSARETARDDASLTPPLPFRAQDKVDDQREAEIRNLRARLAHSESELRAILAIFDRHDET